MVSRAWANWYYFSYAIAKSNKKEGPPKALFSFFLDFFDFSV